jgi:signal peptide peptidase SppA
MPLGPLDKLTKKSSTPKERQFACRPLTLAGVWSIEEHAFQSLLDQAMEALATEGNLEILQARSAELAQEDDAHPYEVDDAGIAHFAVKGPMTRYPTSMQSLFGGVSSIQLGSALRSAARDPHVVGAMLHIDSPGGHSTVQADLRRDVGHFRESKPIHARIEGMGCSAAYGLAAECSSISCDPAAMVGSVGTMMSLKDTSKVFERAGVKPLYITTGDRKAAINPGVSVSDETVDYLQELVQSAGTEFREAVIERRPQISKDGMKDVLRGGVYAGHQAKDIGLVDRVCDLRTAVDEFTDSVTKPKEPEPAPAPVNQPQPAAPANKGRKMLTAQQLESAKQIPGCEDATVENADEKLFAAAQNLKTENAQVKQQLANKVDKPTPVAPGILKQSARTTLVLLNDAVNKQAITPAQKAAVLPVLVGEVKEDGTLGDTLNASMLTPNDNGECVAHALVGAMATGTVVAPKKDEKAGIQAAPRTIAGAPQGDDIVNQLEQQSREYGKSQNRSKQPAAE